MDYLRGLFGTSSAAQQPVPQEKDASKDPVSEVAKKILNELPSDQKKTELAKWMKKLTIKDQQKFVKLLSREITEPIMKGEKTDAWSVMVKGVLVDLMEFPALNNERKAELIKEVKELNIKNDQVILPSFSLDAIDSLMKEERTDEWGKIVQDILVNDLTAEVIDKTALIDYAKKIEGVFKEKLSPIDIKELPLLSFVSFNLALNKLLDIPFNIETSRQLLNIFAGKEKFDDKKFAELEWLASEIISGAPPAPLGAPPEFDLTKSGFRKFAEGKDPDFHAYFTAALDAKSASLAKLAFTTFSEKTGVTNYDAFITTAIDTNNLQLAQDIFKIAVKQKKANPMTYQHMIRAATKEKNYSLAEKVLNISLEEHGPNAAIYNAFFETAVQAKKFDSLQARYIEATKFCEKKDLFVHDALLTELFKTGDFKVAGIILKNLKQ